MSIGVAGLVWCSLAVAQVSGRNAPSVHALPDGMEATAGVTTLRVTALRDDVLRVTAGQNGTMPEEASWAVLPEALHASVKVTPASSGGETGFRTAAVAVSVSADLRLTVRDLAGTVLQQDAAPVEWRGRGFEVAKTKRDDDHFFGLGDKPGPLDRAGKSFVMWNTDQFGWQESEDPIYKSIPFFMEFRAGKAMGVLLDNTWRTYFDFGHKSTEQYSFSAPDGPLTYYLLYGPEPKAVLAQYAWLTGPTPLPPLWSLGFQQSRYTYEPRSRLMEVADRLRADKIPADALYLDIDYQEKNRPFTVDAVKFPEFPAMVKQLAAEHFHLVLITDLHIADLPNAGYAPYDSGTAGDHFMKNADGSVYSGTVWPGPSVFPEFTQAQSRAWWGSLYKEFAQAGVAGFWNDMNEPAVFTYPTKTMPETVENRIDEPGFRKRTATQREIHNVYGMENSRATYEGLLTLEPNTRPFVLTRASYAGGQRYAATWTGDNSATWNHLRMTIPQIENLGLSGFGMTGADVGGFAGSPPPELLTRWLMLAAFQPIDRDHSAKGTRDHEPWVDGPQAEDIRRRYINERYKLMPYLYTTAEEMSRTGLPIMRPLFLEFPQAAKDGHPLDLDAPGEFMFGGSMLIAQSPSPEEVAPYEVHLPAGVWYDYWTGDRYERKNSVQGRDLELRDAAAAEKPIMVTPTLAELPVYVRGGSILPLAPLTQSTDETPAGPLTLRVYAPVPGGACSGSLYQDDGKSFDYRKGKFLRSSFACAAGSDGALTLTANNATAGYRPWWKEIRVEVVGWTPKENTAVVGKKKLTVTREGQMVVATMSAEPSFSLTLR